ncbi:cag [Carabus blaptoides fortunei]
MNYQAGLNDPACLLHERVYTYDAEEDIDTVSNISFSEDDENTREEESCEQYNEYTTETIGISVENNETETTTKTNIKYISKIKVEIWHSKPAVQTVKEIALWLANVREHDARVDGPLMRQKAEELAKKMGKKHFVATEGWFHRWKKRENVVYKRTHGEQKDADFKSAEKEDRK